MSNPMKTCLALMALLIAAPALADAPLPAPETVTVCSSNGLACATSDPVAGVTSVPSPTSMQKPWTIPGWHRWLFVTDDGVSLVVGHSGMNLVPADVSRSEPVLLFYNREVLSRAVTLGDLYAETSGLQRTVSHFVWP